MLHQCLHVFRVFFPALGCGWRMHTEEHFVLIVDRPPYRASCHTLIAAERNLQACACEHWASHNRLTRIVRIDLSQSHWLQRRYRGSGGANHLLGTAKIWHSRAARIVSPLGLGSISGTRAFLLRLLGFHLYPLLFLRLWLRIGRFGIAPSSLPIAAAITTSPASIFRWCCGFLRRRV